MRMYQLGDTMIFLKVKMNNEVLVEVFVLASLLSDNQGLRVAFTHDYYRNHVTFRCDDYHKLAAFTYDHYRNHLAVICVGSI